jgi:hypothetical protein
MRHHRLERLARLTQGAALVGIGLVDVGCSKEPMKPDYRPVPNATARLTPSESAAQKGNATATPSAGDAADAGMTPTPHTINAAPKTSPSR